MVSETTLIISAAAGGLGGCVADSMMHGLDTIKTRMQGQLTSKQMKYNSIKQSYKTILREEGFRGLYGGYLSAAIGSFLSTTIHFGVYEMVKIGLIMNETPDTLAFFLAGATGDFASSIFYVPSELLKTRLQLQGRYNNPHSLSSHNYRNTLHAFKSVYENYGVFGLYKGWSATLIRDVPFTALQFTFYETLKKFFTSSHLNQTSKDTSLFQHPQEFHPVHSDYQHNSKSLTLPEELLSGGLAGMLAGAVTTPLDVIKTYLQTHQQNQPKKLPFVSNKTNHSFISSSSSPNGFWKAARSIYAQRGMKALWKGVGPRVIWTGCQSMIMFVLYERFVTILS